MVVKTVVYLALIYIFVSAESGDVVDHSMDPSYYRCPFSMFDSGLPVTLKTGEVQYCDDNGVSCPKWHFCSSSSSYEDGRSVCCHILGV